MSKNIKAYGKSKSGSKPKKKLKWEPFEITRVKLNPEQRYFLVATLQGQS